MWSAPHFEWSFEFFVRDFFIIAAETVKIYVHTLQTHKQRVHNRNPAGYLCFGKRAQHTRALLNNSKICQIKSARTIPSYVSALRTAALSCLLMTTIST